MIEALEPGVDETPGKSMASSGRGRQWRCLDLRAGPMICICERAGKCEAADRPLLWRWGKLNCEVSLSALTFLLWWFGDRQIRSTAICDFGNFSMRFARP